MGTLIYHTLDVIPRNWYTEIEIRHGTTKWDVLHEGFLLTFSFEDPWADTVEDALQAVKATIFKISQEPRELVQPVWSP